MRKISKLAAWGCVVSLVMAGLAGCGTGTTQGISTDNVSEGANDLQELQNKDIAAEWGDLQGVLGEFGGSELIQHSDTAGKTETVYVIMDADGNRSSTIVSEWLKNPEGKAELSDTSILREIRTVKGTATHTQGEGNHITWQTDGSDVYYQGESDAQLPISVYISYELDGKKVKAEELDGVTGHLAITFDYENHTGTERLVGNEMRTIYQPFMVISGLMFDNEKAANVKVSDGKVINSGDVTMAFGMAMPGLSESLGLEELKDKDGEAIDINIPKQVVIEADVRDFSMLMTLSIASNNVLESLGLNDFKSLDDLKDKTGELSDGMGDIIDGADQLNDGVAKLSDGTGELSNGTNDLTVGASELADGAQKLANGTDKVNNGAKKLKKGTTQVNEGAVALKDGIDQLQAKAPELAQGVTSLKDGAAALSSGLDTIIANNDSLNNGAAAVAGGLSQLNASLSTEEAKTQINALVSGSAGVKTGLEGVAGGLDQIVAGYNPGEGDLEVLIEKLEMDAAAWEQDPANAATAGAIKALIQTYEGMYEKVQAVQTGADALKENYPMVDTGIQTVAGNLQTIGSSVGQLSAGASQLQAGVGSYTAGVNSVKDGAVQLSAGLDTLNGQLPVLVNGIGSLSTGAAALAKGTGDLAKGAKDLAKGTDDLTGGAVTLAQGAGKLSDGTIDLQDGVKKLVDGVSDLLDGTGELKDGVIRFNDEGISKISELVNEDLQKYYDRICAVRDYAKEYTSYSGVDDGVECSVKFIYKTEGIGE